MKYELEVTKNQIESHWKYFETPFQIWNYLDFIQNYFSPKNK